MLGMPTPKLAAKATMSDLLRPLPRCSAATDVVLVVEVCVAEGIVTGNVLSAEILVCLDVPLTCVVVCAVTVFATLAVEQYPLYRPSILVTSVCQSCTVLQPVLMQLDK